MLLEKSPSTPLTPVAATTARADWVDRFKGLAIVLVVLGHVIGGLHSAGVLSDSAMLVYRWIYAFHMPALFFASGLFARQSLRNGYRSFFDKKVRTIAYPYFVWGVITWASQMLMVKYVNNQADPSKPLRLLFSPEAGPWFLYVLFLMFWIFAASNRLGISPSGFLGLSALIYMLGACGLFSFWSALDRTSDFLIYFAIGVAADRTAHAWADKASRRSLGRLFLASLMLFSLLVWFGLDERRGASILPAVAGIMALYALACGLTYQQPGEFFRLCGVMSLEIYVLHPFPSVLGRTVLSKVFQIHTPWMHLAAGLTLGICGSLAISMLCRRMRFPYLFRWERRIARSDGV